MEINHPFEKCSRCDGKGYVFPEDNRSYLVITRCPKCLGLGKLDWVEVVVGVKVGKELPSINILWNRYLENRSNYTCECDKCTGAYRSERHTNENKY